jgi:hypothetical protein
MNSIAIGFIVFACCFGGALFGMFLSTRLPQQHLSAESKNIVNLGMGLVGTMTALVLGLLVASAKSYYDNQSTELTEMSANIVLLDRVLAHYGPETQEVRDLLHGAAARMLTLLWPQDSQQNPQMAPRAAGGEVIFDKIQELSPKNDAQHSLQAQALSMAIDLGKTRWLMFEQGSSSISTPLLAMLVFWLATIFSSFGLFAPRNATVMVSLFLCALTVGTAIFLILEMYSPFQGLIQISSAPVRSALAQLGK